MRGVRLVLVLSLAAACVRAATVREWLARVQDALEDAEERPVVTTLSDDWFTGGTWRHRYGTRAYWLCGMGGGSSYAFPRPFTDLEAFKYRAYIGENCSPGDGLRLWIHWPYLPETVPEGLSEEEREKLRGPLGEMAPAGMDPWTWRDVRRVLLQSLNVGRGRRQASYDDHAESYKPWFRRQGPHLYFNINIPEGLSRLSLYFVNPGYPLASRNPKI